MTVTVNSFAVYDIMRDVIANRPVTPADPDGRFVVFEATDTGDTYIWNGSAWSNNYVDLQASTPGTAQTGNINVSGTGIMNMSEITNVNPIPAFAAPTTFNDFQFNSGQSNLGLLSGGSQSVIVGARYNGTPASPTTILSGQSLASYGVRAYDGTSFFTTNCAEFQATAEENFSSTAHGTRLDFFVTPSGTLTQTNALRIANDGSLSVAAGTLKLVDQTGALYVGGTFFAAKGSGYFSILDTAGNGALTIGSSVSSDPTNYYRNTVHSFSGIAGVTNYLNLASTAVIAAVPVITGSYTVATLPAGGDGMRAYVTDAISPTFLGALTGGGTSHTPVYYNGSAWVAG